MFYENSKVALSMTVDPQAPDPVEMTAAFKESVFALVPVEKKGDLFEVGKVLSDFDVRYGRDPDRWLFATIDHGLATGDAATILAGRGMGVDLLAARKAVIRVFISRLSNENLKTAATELKLAGPVDASPRELRQRIFQAVGSADAGATSAIETALKAKFPAFQPGGVNELAAHKAAITGFVNQLTDQQVTAAAEALNLAGPAAAPASELRQRISQTVRSADVKETKQIERALGDKLEFKSQPWTQ